jgi:hypothetical protein
MACKAVGFFTTVLFLHYFVSLSPGSLRPGQLVSFPLLPRRLRHTVILSQTCENCFCLENLVAIRILGGTVGQGMSALRSMLRPGAMVRALSATSTVHMATYMVSMLQLEAAAAVASYCTWFGQIGEVKGHLLAELPLTPTPRRRRENSPVPEMVQTPEVVCAFSLLLFTNPTLPEHSISVNAFVSQQRFQKLQ